MYKVLNKVNSPEDVKRLNIEELNELASDIREGLFNRLTKIGGHFGPNFGMVEAEIAMHYVFSSPYDKFVFDVSINIGLSVSTWSVAQPKFSKARA